MNEYDKKNKNISCLVYNLALSQVSSLLAVVCLSILKFCGSQMHDLSLGCCLYDIVQWNLL
jgi:hypothetical protein